MVDEVPALGGGPAAVEMLRRGNEATVLRALFTLAEGPGAALPDGEVALEGIRDYVHRAVPLEQVLRGVRIGHAMTTEAFLRACTDLVDLEVAVSEVTAVSRELFSYVDGLTDAMIRTYLSEHEAWSTTAAAARATVVAALLSDDASTDTDVGEASRTLGLRPATRPRGGGGVVPLAGRRRGAAGGGGRGAEGPGRHQDAGGAGRLRAGVGLGRGGAGRRAQGRFVRGPWRRTCRHGGCTQPSGRRPRASRASAAPTVRPSRPRGSSGCAARPGGPPGTRARTPTSPSSPC